MMLRPVDFGAPLVCPVCREALLTDGQRIVCTACADALCPGSFPFESGFPDLVVGGRFDDATNDNATLMEAERQNSEHTTTQFWAPLFRRLAPDGQPLRVLSVGCGAGIEVGLLRAAAFECVGIDNGNRTKAWSGHLSTEALAMANAMHLPFPDAHFDVAFCGCVFPHVGVVGDSSQVSARYHADRLAVAREMTRVVRPGGSIVVSSPNRWFPVDLFHGREIGSYRVPFNPPWRRFLLSKSDYGALFAEAGCAGTAEAVSIRDYWGFCRTGQTWKGRLIGLPVRALLAIGASHFSRVLRTSMLVPWIVVQVRR